MTYVKHSLRFWTGPLLSMGVLAVAGCSSLDLARFAPPGIVKYEDIASKKPPNPAVLEIIEARDGARKKKFPKLYEAPADRPEKRPVELVNEQLVELAGARDSLNAEVADTRSSADAELADSALLTEQRDALDGLLQQDEASARAERTDPPPSADDQ